MTNFSVDKVLVEDSEREGAMNNQTVLQSMFLDSFSISGSNETPLAYYQPYILVPFPKDLAFPVYGILVPIITILTLVSNVLVICVFLKKKMRSVTTLFLAGLACSDTLSVILWCVGHLYFYGIKSDYTIPVQYPLCVFHDYALYLAVMFHATSVWLTTTLGLQRCIIVVKPFWGPRLWTMKKSAFMTVLAYLLSLFFVPLFFMNNYTEIEITENNTTSLVCGVKLDPFFYERLYEYSIINYSFRGIFVQFLPCTLMLITTFVLAYKLKHGKILQRCISSAAEGPKRDFQHRQRTTLMVVIIMVIFLVVEIPNGVVFGIKVYEDLTNHLIIDNETDYSIAILQNFLLLLSYHCNFWIYVALSARFRETLKALICRFKVKYTFERMMTVSSFSPANSLKRKRGIRYGANGCEIRCDFESKTYFSNLNGSSE
ncbi:uncharacterized protein LOC134237516 [Saccostrea cucullata]|uniref:uncharacterized protein LOC134237516 n=1 Tax=Saccostrea cuccullata TaxID=36930 RepID=UPI002ED545A9